MAQAIKLRYGGILAALAVAAALILGVAFSEAEMKDVENRGVGGGGYYLFVP